MLKKISVATLALILYLSPTTTYANEPRPLTLQQAQNRAINNSSALASMGENIEISRDELERNQDRFPGSQGGFIGIINWQSGLMLQQASIAASVNNIPAQHYTLGFIVAIHFTNIFTLEQSLILFDKQLDLQYTNFNITRVQHELNMVSELDYLLATLAYNEMLINRQNIEASITQAHRELNRLIGVDENIIHELIWETSYEVMPNIVNFTGRLNHQRQNHINVRQALDMQRVAQFNLDNHMTPFDPITGTPMPGGFDPESGTMVPTRAQREIELNNASRRVSEERDRITRHIQDTYSNIRLLEHNIQTAHMELEEAYRNLEIATLQLELGMITPVTLNSLNLQIAHAKEQIRQQELNHLLLVMQFQNPNILVF